MEAVGATIGVIYFGGLVLSMFVYRYRAGTGVWHRLTIFGPHGFGLPFLLLTSLKAIAWPIVVVVWLARGRPEPYFVFNEKARRLAAQGQRP